MAQFSPLRTLLCSITGVTDKPC